MNEDYYSSDGGMVSDNARKGKGNNSRKTGLPHFRGNMFKNVPRTEFGEMMGGLTIGIVFVFPALAMLTVAFPLQILAIVLVISLLILLFTKDYIYPLIFIGFSVGMVVMGFIAIFVAMEIFN